MSEPNSLWLSLTDYMDRSTVAGPGGVIAERSSPAIVFVLLSGPCAALPQVHATAGAVVVGVDREGTAPDGFSDAFDILLTINDRAPRPWIAASPGRLEEHLASLMSRTADNGHAATVLAQVLRAGEGLAFDQALLLESLAYSSLQAGAEYHAWRQRQPARTARASPQQVLRVERHGAEIQIVIARPEVHNAYGARMRDEFIEAMQIPLFDASVHRVVLSGDGPSFCSGGDLHEFGTASDPAAAHAVRLRQSAALLVHRLANRVTAQVHGACIGAGIEITAAAAHVSARRSTYFRLPEVAMGLIPGAGGTVSIPRRIGRHRTCFMALTGATIDCDTALHWGLVDAITE